VKIKTLKRVQGDGEVIWECSGVTMK